ncbi:putative Tigger transposable element-derived protein 1-like 306 [Homarus americanus]|uniref:Putative Tigger transposable element-derived protein 1-like 306 n=1 Tax=Homarus americanus TaxID=6706 RepID=A0A8J5N2G5_HOMAM|nr:putative Tigger transposable element-derived protein 1-like 306 [Homarus americanus]
MIHTFSRIWQALDEDIQDGAESLREMWKKFSFTDYIFFIQQVLWPEVVNDFAGFPTVDEDVQHIIWLTRQVGGEWFHDLQEEESQEELLGHAGEELTEEKLAQLVEEQRDEEEEEGATVRKELKHQDAQPPISMFFPKSYTCKKASASCLCTSSYSRPGRPSSCHSQL